MSDESLLDFPCQLTIKVMGINTDMLASDIAVIAQQHVKDFDQRSISVTASSAAKYISLGITLMAEDKAQLDALYRAFYAHPDVKMVL